MHTSVTFRTLFADIPFSPARHDRMEASRISLMDIFVNVDPGRDVAHRADLPEEFAIALTLA